MDNINAEISYMITRYIWTTLIHTCMLTRFITLYRNTIHDNEVYMDNLNTEIPYMITRFIWTTRFNTEIPYMITRFIWTILIQKYHAC